MAFPWSCSRDDGIILTKDSSLLLHAIRSLFYWRILLKTTLYFGFETPNKKIREKKLESLHEYHFVEQKNEDRKPDKISESEKTQVFSRIRIRNTAETSTNTAVQEFHIWIKSFSSLSLVYRLRAILLILI